MKLAEKIRYPREVEGSLRGLDRAMTQQELGKAIAAEAKGKTISQSYVTTLKMDAKTANVVRLSIQLLHLYLHSRVGQNFLVVAIDKRLQRSLRQMVPAGYAVKEAQGGPLHQVVIGQYTLLCVKVDERRRQLAVRFLRDAAE